tara:strand:+ start:507 stop:968 length:462 start_codon:yes stop_codon:yes gene_type:complete
MAESDVIQYDKAELRRITGALKAMDDEAIAQAKEQAGALATYLQGKIIVASGQLFNWKVAGRIAQGIKVSQSSKIGELSIGFASQKFSGGATTRDLWGGSEFGSNKFRQFPIWSGKTGRGSTGYFIYPTLRAEQSYLIDQWEKSFTSIVKKFN